MVQVKEQITKSMELNAKFWTKPICGQILNTDWKVRLWLCL